MEKSPFIEKAKRLIIGKPHALHDNRIFQRLSLIAFFAWVGLGADGLSSCCYGPQEAFLALGGHIYLSIFVAFATVLTILVISASYSQIVEVFPTGGGGYVVASKLLSPNLGMVAGCALLIDYVLTITVSIASGADAIFSLLPWHFHAFKLVFAMVVVIILMVMNMRGVKESVLPLVPIFLIFLGTHVFIILYALATKLPSLPALAGATAKDIHTTASTLGYWGMALLVLRAYSMGAGTYTGLEAVSNGIDMLREPKVDTAKKTMTYMAISLSFIVLGIMVAYLLYQVTLVPGKTLNAVMFEHVTAPWKRDLRYIFISVTLFSEAMLLFVAAQTGFLGGPKVLASMATDRWLPAKFSTLSD
ncbi:MAG: APC family permease, partial [Candidatus Omnitrophica bacterium]|nr:APC family permease [Candidatus Omnitrophota bacterium]